jgi:hypothetical protein
MYPIMVVIGLVHMALLGYFLHGYMKRNKPYDPLALEVLAAFGTTAVSFGAKKQYKIYIAQHSLFIHPALLAIFLLLLLMAFVGAGWRISNRQLNRHKEITK